MLNRFLRNDKVFLLLFLNTVLVILGYALARVTGFASVEPMKIFRTLLFFASTLYVFSQKDTSPSSKALKYNRLIIALCLITPLFAFISNDVGDSMNRTLTFLIPLIYIWRSVCLLVYRYGQKKTLQLLSAMIMIVYLIPMLSYVAFGGSFSGESIYGASEGQVFVSNHFGWSAALFLISIFHGSMNSRSKGLIQKLVFYLLILLGLYLLIASGNRSAWLAIALSLVVILFYYKGLPIYQKFLIVIFPIILFSYLISQKNEAVSFVIERTKRKQESGNEGRLERIDLIAKRLSENPTKWVTGVGMFNYDAFDKEGTGISNYHNSYFEILFGLGVPLFILFMIFMIYEPLKQFLNRVSKYDLLLIPLIIIPFFESNITSGQFLFFPWFSYIFALNAKKKFAFFGSRNWYSIINPNQFEKTHPGHEKMPQIT